MGIEYIIGLACTTFHCPAAVLCGESVNAGLDFFFIAISPHPLYCGIETGSLLANLLIATSELYGQTADIFSQSLKVQSHVSVQ